MLEALPLIVVTFILVSAFISIAGAAQLEDVRVNWEKRRCEVFVMTMAQMVPTDPNINTSDFASENFKFCMGKHIDSILSIFFSPILKIFDHQINLTEPLKNVMNHLNKSVASLIKPFLGIFDSLNKKITAVIYQIIRIFYKVQYSMDRVFGIATASVFAGISMFKAIMNSINLVINIILIILAILVVLVIFFWFVMWPVVPIILTVIGVLSTTVAGASAAGFAGAFCVAPGTEVILEGGSTKLVEELEAGDKLLEGVVEGVLRTTGSGGKCVKLKGITISSCHLVFYNDSWIPAGEHPDALPTSSPEILYCLNTSSRTWPVQGTEKLLLRDWEELPDSEDSDTMWEEIIYEMLNRQAIVSSSSWSAPGRGLLGAETPIYVLGKGLVPIKDVKIGDVINDSISGYFHNNPSYTRVLGIYKDNSEKVPISGPNEASWVWLENKRLWRHPLHAIKTQEGMGYHLITESGTFMAGPHLMRDFTEVGSSRIHETYSKTLSLL